MAADPRGWVRERLRTTHAGRHQDSSNKSLEKNISNYWTKLDSNVHAQNVIFQFMLFFFQLFVCKFCIVGFHLIQFVSLVTSRPRSDGWTQADPEALRPALAARLLGGNCTKWRGTSADWGSHFRLKRVFLCLNSSQAKIHIKELQIPRRGFSLP